MLIQVFPPLVVWKTLPPVVKLLTTATALKLWAGKTLIDETVNVPVSGRSRWVQITPLSVVTNIFPPAEA
jgi:hypothetical protein